jgi:hypothetical protein
MVEKKCINFDKAAQLCEPKKPKIPDDHWQALIALHRTLLHEHHDFFLASQHPSASPALKRLAQKYSMPARMWDHAISSFLRLLGHRSSDDETSRLESMAAFLQYALSMMRCLQDTLPSMADDWAMIIDALQEYEDLLQQLYAKQADDWKHDAYATGPFGQCDSAPENTLSDWLSPQYGHDNDYDRSIPLDEGSEATPWLPQHIIDTLSGWLYYGQAITPSFNIFTKVFAALSLATHQCRYSYWKLW